MLFGSYSPENYLVALLWKVRKVRNWILDDRSASLFREGSLTSQLLLATSQRLTYFTESDSEIFLFAILIFYLICYLILFNIICLFFFHWPSPKA